MGSDEADTNGNIYDENGEWAYNINRKFSGLYLPDLYKVYYDDEIRGIYQNIVVNQEIESVKICSTPCIPTGIGINIDGGNDYLILSFEDYNKGSISIPVKQSTLLSNRKIEALIDEGIRFDSSTAKNLNGYFKECLDKNEKYMNTFKIAERNGWKENNTLYVIGDAGYTKDGIVDIYQTDSGAGNHLKLKGNLETWIEGTKDVIHYDIVRLKIYIAAAAFVLRFFDITNILFHHHGDSSGGKTFTTQIAIGCFGNPNADGLMNSKTTIVAAERHLTRYCDLPTFFDETSRMSKYVLDQLIFEICNGVTGARGRPDGTYEEGIPFNGSTYTTGENPIVDEESFEGEQVRVIQTDENLPLGMGDIVDAASLAIQNNYGFFTQPLLQKIFENRDKFESKYMEAKKRITTSDDNKENRIAKTFAVIEIAGKIVEEIFSESGIIPKNVEDIVDHFYNQKITESKIEKPHVIMLQHMVDWYHRNQNYFEQSNTINNGNISLGQKLGYVSVRYIDIPKDIFEKAMEDYNQKRQMKRIYRDWKKEDVIITDNEPNRYTKKVKGKNVIRFSIVEIDKVLGTNLSNTNGNSTAKKLNMKLPVTA